MAGKVAGKHRFQDGSLSYLFHTYSTLIPHLNAGEGLPLQEQADDALDEALGSQERGC